MISIKKHNFSFLLLTIILFFTFSVSSVLAYDDPGFIFDGPPDNPGGGSLGPGGTGGSDGSDGTGNDEGGDTGGGIVDAGPSPAEIALAESIALNAEAAIQGVDISQLSDFAI